MSNAAEALRQRFQARAPGGSARAFAADERGTSSYLRLVQTTATALGNVTVLDLARGDRYGLARQRQRLGDDTRLIGVDLSLDELGTARAAESKNRLAVRTYSRHWLMLAASIPGRTGMRRLPFCGADAAGETRTPTPLTARRSAS